MRHRRDDAAPQIRPHRQQRAHQQTAVGTAADRRFSRAGPAFLLDALGRRDEIGEAVFLVRQTSPFMPAGAVFAAPAEIDADIDPALADPVDDVQIDKRIIIGRQDRVVITAVAIHQRRGTAGLFQPLRHDDKGWNALAVRSLGEDLPDFDILRRLRIRLIQHRQLIAGQLQQHR